MEGRRSFIKGATTLATAAVLSTLGDTARAADDTVRVGVLLELSGPSAPYGIPERDMIKFLAAKYNAEGGINGHKLELFYYDDQTDPTIAARGATALIRQDNVQVILGTSTGSTTLASAPIAARAEVPMLPPISTQSVTDKSQSFFPWIFRASVVSSVTIQAMMQKVVFKPNIKKVAIFFQEDAYGKQEADLAEAAIKEQGGIDIVALVSGPLSATDLTAQATRIRNMSPDLVLMLTSAPVMGGAFLRGAELAGLKAPILGSLSIAQKALVEAAGKAGEGVMSATLGNWDAPSPKQAELGKMLEQAGRQPEGYSDIIGGVTIITLAEALRHIDGSVTGAKIRDALEHICGFNGTYADGPLCYSKDQHDGFGPDTVNFVKLHNGKWENMKL